MFTFSVCVEMIFGELPFVDRLRRTAEVGFEAVEFWGWGNKDIEAVKSVAGECDLTIAAIGASGGSLVDPSNHDGFREGVEASLNVARDLGCPNLIVTTGNEIEGLDRSTQHESIVAGLTSVAPLAEEAGVMLVLEPLNIAVDHAGYYLSSSYEGYDILRKVDSSNVKMLFDIYHQQITEGNLTSNVTSHIDLMGHFHVADVPGRHEPGTGEINYANVFQAIAESGYDRYVGLEFGPSVDAAEALEKVKALEPHT